MSKSFQLNLVLKGILIASGVALLLSLILSLLFTFTPLRESSSAYNFIVGVSVFVAAVVTAYRAGTKGLYYGIGIGMVFIVLLLLLFTVLSPDTLSWLALGEKSIICIATGGIGGIIGVIIRR
ncbi:putative membrane protein, TIGR04086 family/integral membrane protein, TIGR04097 family [Desulfitobacterium dichloroeliminans LMG P-21439]|uniref:Putative membrane protein, TIGR04086 family/integral membrane protein, TIGR04097 family n=1 Tax=Desulfitobacterium dichloroeliminans (strain LMG P-21439 / DCA1) TaxID=871963 RepID=L0F936_DESDL|nr:TIGR04086 family membrane protein [Desulfitobacterium dichloroeliminans]AGA69510.1 putative membrane protein, TIGR04086 family/integral membrane protein, TIGR04097 family [Desulfitobacterium dichloroeliminans LMG P-21439]